MNPLDQVNAYLRSLESRLRWTAVSRGSACIAVAALIATVLLVIITNSYAFSEGSLRIARVLLFICLGLAVSFGLAVPLLNLSRRRAAKLAERRVPEFNERLLTFAERHPQNDPFLELLAADTMDVARTVEPEHIVGKRGIFGALSAATVAVLVLGWLVLYGPGWMGHGASLLWAGTPREGMRPAYYQVLVTPGNRTVRRRSDQIIAAQLVGFTTNRVQLFARYDGTSKWEPVLMQPQETGFEFLLAGLPESVDYYVEAGGVRSANYRLTTVDLPAIKKIRVTYSYPKWAGLKNVVEDPGGDLRAVEGSTALVEIQTDKPLGSGLLVMDGDEPVQLKTDGLWLRAEVPIKKDGMYHVAALEKGEQIRLSEDYFIEAQKEEAPKVRIARPGRDARVNPIEEVTVQVEAEDDFALQDVALHYSVNGGPEKTIPLLKNKGAKTAEGQTLIALEDFKLVPGDLVSFYAKARDARAETSSDIMFLEAQPFEREYEQSQMAGGGGGMGGGQEQDNVSQRQKEIIAATFNQLREKNRDKAAESENAKFLSEMQAKLRDQSKSLAQRMQSRELSGANQEFRSFTSDMTKAADAMGEAVEKLKTKSWKEAITPEQVALQHLLRAEATRRKIQVAFGSRGQGGGGGGAGRDLESLFDLELDTEKNQYETGQQSASNDQRNREIDEAMQKLEQLARRQQELAQQQRDNKQTPQQRWQQEMLRREAEELRRKMEQMSRRQQASRGQQQGQQSGQQGQQSSQSGQSGQSGQSASDSRVRQALERLTRATEDMRRAASQPTDGQQQAGSADARRAADRLSEAQNALRNLRQQESGQELDSISQRAGQLAEQQNEFVKKLREAFGEQQPGQPRPGATGTREQADQLSKEKEQMLSDLNRLERDMQNAVRNLAGTQRGASSKLRDALGSMQQDELKMRMKYGAEYIRRGYGSYMVPREAPVTQGLNRLAEQTREAQAQAGQGKQESEKQGRIERALNQVERLREQLARASGQQGQRGQQGQGQQQGQGGQQGQRGQQPGQGQGQGQQGQAQGQGQQGGQGQQQGQGQGQGQGGGDQPGGNGQRGSGDQVAGGGQGGGRYGDRFGSMDRMYRSGDNIPQQGATNPGIEQAMREGMRELSQLRQEMRDSPELEREVQDALKELQKYDPAKIAADPLLAERIRSAVLPAIEQLELQLRRKLDGNESQVRSSAAERIPEGYADAVAEYFRRLSKGK